VQAIDLKLSLKSLEALHSLGLARNNVAHCKCVHGNVFTHHIKKKNILMVLFRNKYRIESTRLMNWDYRNEAAYLTICTKNKEHFFGEIINKAMKLSTTGAIVKGFWHEIENHFDSVSLDAFTVMPNHIHGIVILHKKSIHDTVETLHCNISTVNVNKKNEYMSNISPKSGSLSTIIRSYKSICSKHIHLAFPDMNFEWQGRFHDHIIRDAASYDRIRSYILSNAENWKDDMFYK
jgi:putative transposase